MTLADIIAAARLRMDDKIQPYLCSDADLTLHAAEGEGEAAMRADLLYDDSSSFLRYTLAADKDRYTLDSRVWRIDRAWMVLTGRTRESPLVLTGIDRLRPPAGSCGCGPTHGRPQAAAHVGRTLRLWPIPRADNTGTLYLGVYRLPLFPLEDPSDEPEIDEPHHVGLVDWMLYRSFGNKDSELYDPQRSAQALGEFTLRFGERDSADVHRQHNERRRVTTVYGGY